MIDQLLISVDTSLRMAMRLINVNGLGIAFVVAENGCLKGVVTDGDIRRALLDGCNLDTCISEVMQTSYIALPVSANRQEIINILLAKSSISIIPLVDDMGCPVDYASMRRLRRIPVAEPDLQGNELDYLTKCIRDGWISSQGPFVNKFENDFAKYIGVPHAIATSSGTTALHLALAAIGVGPGDEVIVPDLTFAASANAIIYCGARPVFADVELETWNLCPASLSQKITSRTKAILVVHLYGQPAAMNEILAIANRYSLSIVEDGAEALGASYNGRQVGSFGQSAAFSFFGNKLITTGEGGMMVARTEDVATKARILRDHGMNPSKRYWHDVIGFNYRMTNLQAAIGLAQLERITQFIDRKNEIQRKYNEVITELIGIVLAKKRPFIRDICWLYSFLTDPSINKISRDEIIGFLAEAGIEARPVFYPLHRMAPYHSYTSGQEFPNADWLSDNGLSLPSSVGITDEEISYICDIITRRLARMPGA